MKLISMTDYVLEQKELKIMRFVKLNRIENYANFLKQPLNLGMFIPCDENGNVIEKPISPDHPYNDKQCDIYMQYSFHLDEYQKSKEKVLFEDFEIRNKDNFYFVEKKESSVWFRVLKNTNKTIEHLIPLWVEIKLTDNAIKQL